MESVSWVILSITVLVAIVFLTRNGYEARWRYGPHRLELRPARRRRAPPTRATKSGPD